jgi:hypothetical protein
MRSVVLYGREGCCLCDEARVVLQRARAKMPFALREIDIEGDERLHRTYLERIPVVTIDDVEAFEYVVDENELLRRLGGEPTASGEPTVMPERAS